MDSHTGQGTPGTSPPAPLFNIRHNHLIHSNHVTYEETLVTFNNLYGTYSKNPETLL